jgi:membrane dipeptidase
LTACAAKGGVIGIEAAPHTTLTWNQRSHGLDAYMEHFEYVKELVGIEHVGFGPDSLYGDHVGLHKVYAANLSLKEAHGGQKGGDGGKGMEYQEVTHVEGVENPTEASHNIVRWLVKHGYSDDDIRKVVGGNAIRLLQEVWG